MERFKFILKVIGVAIMCVGFVVGVSIIFSKQYGISNAPTLTLGTINVLVLVFLAYYTYKYAKSTALMAKDTQEQRMVASQPLVIQKPMYEIDIYEGATSEYFSHFVIWNAGNGPAIELVYSILNAQKSSALYVSHRRKTFLRSDEETLYHPEIFRLEEGNYYLVSQYMSISRLTGKESVSQTWLPFKISKASKEGKVYVAPGELSFKFDVHDEDLLDVFPRSSKPQ